MPEIPLPPKRREQRLLRNARREGLVIMAVWAVCLAWSTLYSAWFGYRPTVGEVPLVLGMPSWVFWGILLPWALALVFSAWFCFFYMADDDLGTDRDEGAGHA